MSSKEESLVSDRGRRLSCSPCFDALWFCYSPVHQMQQYYRLGVLDNCSDKWSALYDCLVLKTKRSSEVQKVGVELVFGGAEGDGLVYPIYADSKCCKGSKSCGVQILETREKAKPHIWTFRTPEEASSNWKEQFGHLDKMD